MTRLDFILKAGAEVPFWVILSMESVRSVFGFAATAPYAAVICLLALFQFGCLVVLLTRFARWLSRKKRI